MIAGAMTDEASTSVEECRRLADDALTRVSREDDPGARAFWERLALQWARLADLIEARQELRRKTH